jgi:hypothetical protein
MVVADWTSAEPPPPPESATSPPAPAAPLIPAFGPRAGLPPEPEPEPEPEPPKPLSGWGAALLDPPDEDELEPEPAPPPSLLDRYRWWPAWARLGLPALALVLAVLAVAQLTGDDGPPSDEALLREAVAASRDAGAPAALSDPALGELIEGVCSAAKRQLVSLTLSQQLAAAPLASKAQLTSAAEAVGVGAATRCEDQVGAIPQVLTLLVARTERMITTTTSSTTSTTVAATTTSTAAVGTGSSLPGE